MNVAFDWPIGKALAFCACGSEFKIIIKVIVPRLLACWGRLLRVFVVADWIWRKLNVVVRIENCRSYPEKLICLFTILIHDGNNNRNLTIHYHVINLTILANRNGKGAALTDIEGRRHSSDVTQENHEILCSVWHSWVRTLDLRIMRRTEHISKSRIAKQQLLILKQEHLLYFQYIKLDSGLKTVGFASTACKPICHWYRVV